MAKPSLPSLSSSLADKLKAAGVIDAKAAAAVEEGKRQAAAAARLATFEAARRAGTIAGISAYYVQAAVRGETLAELLAWGSAWFEELAAAGHAAELARQGIRRPSATRASPSSDLTDEATREERDDALAELEGWLGCSLPPSVRRMLHELGGVDWGAGHTLAAGQMVEHQAHLRDLLARFAAPLPELAAYARAELQLIPLAQLDGNYDFVLRNARGADDESPIYFVHHDEAHLYGGALAIEEWFATKLEVVMERFADRAARG